MHVVSTHVSDHRHTNAMKRALAGIEAPGWAVVFGDRRDMLEAALDLHYQGVKLIHVGGGDTPHGTDSHPDHRTRDAISMLARVHCVANWYAARNVMRLVCGDAPVLTEWDYTAAWEIKRLCESRAVYLTGSPGLDEVVAYAKTRPRDAAREGCNHGPLVLINAHPGDGVRTKQWFQGAWAAAKLAGYSSGEYGVWLTGNGDASDFFSGLGQRVSGDEFLSALNVADVFITNSSAGLYEAPILGTPVELIGDRQKGRQGPYHHPDGKACEAIRRVVIEVVKPYPSAMENDV